MPPPTKPLWTQEQAIAFESARECITDLAGIYTGLIEDARRQAFPDEVLIQSLRARRSALAQERAELRLQDGERIAKVRQEYGEQIKVFRAGCSGTSCSICPHRSERASQPELRPNAQLLCAHLSRSDSDGAVGSVGPHFRSAATAAGRADRHRGQVSGHEQSTANDSYQ